MADRATAHWTVDVNRAPEEVFGYLADVSRHGEWSPKPYRVEGAPSGSVTKGATFTSYGWVPGDKEHRNEVEVTEVDPPRTLVLTANDPSGGVFINTFTVTPSNGGCRVDREMDMPTPNGVVGALFPLLLRTFIKPAVMKGMNMFKKNLESGAAARS